MRKIIILSLLLVFGIIMPVGSCFPGVSIISVAEAKKKKKVTLKTHRKNLKYLLKRGVTTSFILSIYTGRISTTKRNEIYSKWINRNSTIDTAKQLRKERADKTISQIDSVRAGIESQIYNVSYEMDSTHQTIVDIYDLPLPMDVIVGRAAPYESHLVSLQGEYTLLTRKRDKLNAIRNELQNYVDFGISISSDDIVYLNNLGITF